MILQFVKPLRISKAVNHSSHVSAKSDCLTKDELLEFKKRVGEKTTPCLLNSCLCKFLIIVNVNQIQIAMFQFPDHFPAARARHLNVQIFHGAGKLNRQVDV